MSFLGTYSGVLTDTSEIVKVLLFDCFWFNAHPNWGSFDPSVDDDPGLDRDDTDGAGPENLFLVTKSCLEDGAARATPGLQGCHQHS